MGLQGLGVSAVLVSSRLSPGGLDVPAFLRLNLATYLTALAMASIVFFCSCLFNSTAHAAAAGTGVLVLFFILSTIGRFGHHEGVYGTIACLSIFRLLRARAIVGGQINMWINDAVLLAITAAAIGAGIAVFKRKDMPF